MKFIACLKVLIFLSVGVLHASGASAKDVAPSMQTEDGTAYASACSPTEWKKIQVQILQLPDFLKLEGLADLVHTFLCGSTAAANAKLHRNMPLKIAMTSEATGEESKPLAFAPRSDFSALGGSAWNVQIIERESGIAFSYAPNEACIASAKFVFKASAWMLVALDEACD